MNHLNPITEQCEFPRLKDKLMELTSLFFSEIKKSNQQYYIIDDRIRIERDTFPLTYSKEYRQDWSFFISFKLRENHNLSALVDFMMENTAIPTDHLNYRVDKENQSIVARRGYSDLILSFIVQFSKIADPLEEDFDSSLFYEEYIKMEQSLLSDTLQQKVFWPIENMIAEIPEEGLTLRKGLLLRKINLEELEQVANYTRKMLPHHIDYVIEFVYEMPKSKMGDPTQMKRTSLIPINTYSNVIRSLRILKKGFFRSLGQIETPVGWRSSSSVSYRFLPFNELYFMKTKFHLLQKEIPCLLRIIDLLQQSPDFSQITNALSRFDSYYDRGRVEDQLIDLVTVLEIILGGERSDSISHKISTRAAILLGQDIESKNKIRSDIKRIYTVRSQLVHEGKINAEFKFGGESKNIAEGLITVEKYIRKVLSKSLKILLTCEKYNDFLDFLDFNQI